MSSLTVDHYATLLRWRSSIRSISLNFLPEGLRGNRVTARHGMRVPVQCGGDAAVIETARYDGKRDARVEHLGRHEVPEIMQPELAQTGVTARAQERLWLPGWVSTPARRQDRR
jgi:hypothetical protein